MSHAASDNLGRWQHVLSLPAQSQQVEQLQATADADAGHSRPRLHVENLNVAPNARVIVGDVYTSCKDFMHELSPQEELQSMLVLTN